MKRALIVAKGESMKPSSIDWTVVGDATAANAVIESVIAWDRHLAHMSKQGLKVLLDRNLLSGPKYTNLDSCEE